MCPFVDPLGFCEKRSGVTLLKYARSEGADGRPALLLRCLCGRASTPEQCAAYLALTPSLAHRRNSALDANAEA